MDRFFFIILFLTFFIELSSPNGCARADADCYYNKNAHEIEKGFFINFLELLAKIAKLWNDHFAAECLRYENNILINKPVKEKARKVKVKQ